MPDLFDAARELNDGLRDLAADCGQMRLDILDIASAGICGGCGDLHDDHDDTDPFDAWLDGVSLHDGLTPEQVARLAWDAALARDEEYPA